jgi:predicted SAM-dependent methyltransferase
MKQRFHQTPAFKCIIKFTLSCCICTSSLFAGINEDKDRIQKISNLRGCLDILQTIMYEKMQIAEPANLEHAQFEVNSVFSSIDFLKANPRDLTTVAWDLYPKFAKAYSLLNYPQISSDEHFTLYGFKKGIIEEVLNLKIIEAFSSAKSIPYLLSDYDPNYLSSKLGIETQETLNKDHTYLMLETLQKDPLSIVLSSLKEPVSDCLGSAWRVVTIRAWKSYPATSEFGPNSWHSDGMPTSVYKIMYYPFGVDYEHGTVELQTAGGVHALEGPPGTWMLFKNSEIIHRGVRPQVGERLAVEITIVPALEYDLRAISAGLNARHPHLPWQQLSSTNHPLYSKGSIIGVNIGGGPHWGCHGWVNLEEVPSPSNPTPFQLYPNCKFPFTDASIKTVYTSHALEHLNLSTVYRVLSESYRVLEVDGNLIIKIPDYDRALDCWRRQDHSFFGSGWNIESVTPTWRHRGLKDCLDYRAAMIFCSFFNDVYGNPFEKTSGSISGKAYFGPPVVDVDFLRNLIKDHTPSQITQALCLEIGRKESNYHFCHQSAWSRAELQNLLNEFGFEVVSFDPNVISRTFDTIPGMYEMISISTYCWAKKKLS